MNKKAIAAFVFVSVASSVLVNAQLQEPPAPTPTKPVQVEGVPTPAAKAKAEAGLSVESAPVLVEQTGSQVYILIINSVFALLGTIFTGVMAYLMARLNIQAKEAAVVNTETRNVGIETKKTVDSVHTLVNSNMRIALEANAILARRLADMTGITSDRNAADVAEKKVVMHDAAQAEVDAQEKAKRGSQS